VNNITQAPHKTSKTLYINPGSVMPEASRTLNTSSYDDSLVPSSSLVFLFQILQLHQLEGGIMCDLIAANIGW
jgi:hypothetical protein